MCWSIKLLPTRKAIFFAIALPTPLQYPNLRPLILVYEDTFGNSTVIIIFEKRNSLSFSIN